MGSARFRDGALSAVIDLPPIVSGSPLLRLDAEKVQPD
jgi:hypothetical protein